MSVVQLVKTPTRGSAILDKILVSESLLSFYCNQSCNDVSSSVTVGAPIGNSDHSTVFLKPLLNQESDDTFCISNTTYFVKVYDCRESHVESFKKALSAFSWDSFYKSHCSVEEKSEMFYRILNGALLNVPCRLVEMSGREKPWITPKLKLMINLRYDAYRCLLYTSPSPRDLSTSRMPSSA